AGARTGDLTPERRHGRPSVGADAGASVAAIAQHCATDHRHWQLDPAHGRADWQQAGPGALARDGAGRVIGSQPDPALPGAAAAVLGRMLLGLLGRASLPIRQGPLAAEERPIGSLVDLVSSTKVAQQEDQAKAA